MSKRNKNVDPAYAELKRENARLKAALFQAESKSLVNKTLLEEVLNRYHIDLKKRPICSRKTLESAKVRGQKLSITYLCQLLEVSRKGYYKHTFTEQDEDVKVASVLHYCQYVRGQLPNAGVDTLQQCANEYFKGVFK